MYSNSVRRSHSVSATCAFMVLLFPLLALGADQAQPEKSGAIDKKPEAKPGCGCGGVQAKGTWKLCCYFPFAWTESYVTWYAEICEPREWVCYDAPLDNPTDAHPFCTDPPPGACIDIPDSEIRYLQKNGIHYVIAKDLKTKGHKKQRMSGQKMTVLDAHFGSGQRTGNVRKLEIKLCTEGGNPVSIFAEVAEIVVKRTGFSVPMDDVSVYLGNQVEKPATIDATIDVGNVMVVDPGQGQKSNVLIVTDNVNVEHKCRIVTRDKIKPW